MTAVEPQRLALLCGAPHPLLPELLCERLSGHGPVHGTGDGDSWDEGWEDDE